MPWLVQRKRSRVLSQAVGECLEGNFTSLQPRFPNVPSSLPCMWPCRTTETSQENPGSFFQELKNLTHLSANTLSRGILLDDSTLDLIYILWSVGAGSQSSRSILRHFTLQEASSVLANWRGVCRLCSLRCQRKKHGALNKARWKVSSHSLDSRFSGVPEEGSLLCSRNEHSLSESTVSSRNSPLLKLWQRDMKASEGGNKTELQSQRHVQWNSTAKLVIDAQISRAQFNSEQSTEPVTAEQVDIWAST